VLQELLLNLYESIEVNLLYRMVSAQFKYLYFALNTEEKISSLSGIIGSMSVCSIWKGIPRKSMDSESVMRVNDLINVVDKMDLYVNSSRVKLCRFTFWHQVGQPTSLARLLAHVGNPEPREEVAVASVPTRAGAMLRIDSAFDHLGNVHKVIKDMPDGRVLCKCAGVHCKDMRHGSIEQKVNEKRG
jgi:hypothetical protein